MKSRPSNVYGRRLEWRCTGNSRQENMEGDCKHHHNLGGKSRGAKAFGGFFNLSIATHARSTSARPARMRRHGAKIASSAGPSVCSSTLVGGIFAVAAAFVAPSISRSARSRSARRPASRSAAGRARGSPSVRFHDPSRDVRPRGAPRPPVDPPREPPNPSRGESLSDGFPCG